MVDPAHTRLSLVRQCRLVSIARSSFYYAGTGESPLNLRRRWCAVTSVRRGPGHRDGRRGMIST